LRISSLGLGSGRRARAAPGGKRERGWGCRFILDSYGSLLLWRGVDGSLCVHKHSVTLIWTNDDRMICCRYFVMMSSPNREAHTGWTEPHVALSQPVLSIQLSILTTRRACMSIQKSGGCTKRPRPALASAAALKTGTLAPQVFMQVRIPSKQNTSRTPRHAHRNILQVILHANPLLPRSTFRRASHDNTIPFLLPFAAVKTMPLLLLGSRFVLLRQRTSRRRCGLWRYRSAVSGP